MLSKIYKFKLFSILSYYLARTAKNHFATGDYVKIYTSLLCEKVKPKTLRRYKVTTIGWETLSKYGASQTNSLHLS